MVHASHHHQCRVISKIRAEARKVDASREQFALLAHVLDRVVREALQRVTDFKPASFGIGAHACKIEYHSGQQRLPLIKNFAACVRRRNLHRDRIPVGE